MACFFNFILFSEELTQKRTFQPEDRIDRLQFIGGSHQGGHLGELTAQKCQKSGWKQLIRQHPEIGYVKCTGTY